MLNLDFISLSPLAWNDCMFKYVICVEFFLYWLTKKNYAVCYWLVIIIPTVNLCQINCWKRQNQSWGITLPPKPRHNKRIYKTWMELLSYSNDHSVFLTKRHFCLIERIHYRDLETLASVILTLWVKKEQNCIINLLVKEEYAHVLR